jgi:hypothetical protein
VSRLRRATPQGVHRHRREFQRLGVLPQRLPGGRGRQGLEWIVIRIVILKRLELVLERLVELERLWLGCREIGLREVGAEAGCRCCHVIGCAQVVRDDSGISFRSS